MDCVLVGARDDQQVKENVKALSFKLKDDELKTIRQHVEELALVD
jgi:aryl-alcohol dehydrogenase-like predicted oxidoreductase